MEKTTSAKDVVEQFRGSLEDAIVIIEKLTPYCDTFGEMVDLCQQALNNGSTFKLVLEKFTTGSTRR